MLEVYINNEKIELEVFKFPGGEVHFKVVGLNSYTNVSNILITTDLKDSDELMLLLLVSDYINSLHIDTFVFELNLLYIPYARQDKNTNYEPFSLGTFARLINSCKFDKVNIDDPHSDITPIMINKTYNLRRLHSKILIELMYDSPPDIIVSPDAGALKKNEKLCKQYKLPHVVATKNRDVETGEITNTQVHTDLDLKGKKLLIVDDICDGGRTFIELAKVLKKYEPKEINLYVTYGIFSKGYDVVKEHFDNITVKYRRDPV